MNTFKALMFLFFGVGLLVMDWQALTKGWLPAGPNGLRGRRDFRRDEDPIAFWFMFLVYGAGGLWLTVHALRLLLGKA